MQQMNSASDALDSQQLRDLLGQLVPEHENHKSLEQTDKAST
jgi:hypothetical protein